MLEIFPFSKELAEKLLKYCYQQARLTYFKLANRKPPLNEIQASHIAHSVLAGEILSAKAYKNLDSKHTFIAVVRKNSGESSDRRIFLLEQIGNTYRPIWFSDPLFSMQSKFDIEDINRDGIHEIIYSYESFGTGAGMRILNVYLPKDNQVVQLSENYDWQNTIEPAAPKIEIKPKIDKKLFEAIERHATKVGFLQEETISTSSLKYRQQLWHINKNNHRKETELLMFPGKPDYGNSVTARLELQNIIWTAYFKGPLIGYLKSQDQHFIAYSPLNFYSWVTALTSDGERIWFSVHDSPDLFSFALVNAKGYLRRHYLPVDSQPFDIENFECSNGNLLINNKIKIPISNLLNQAAGPRKP